jgi:transposase-like protein
MSVFISWSEKESLSHEGALLLQKWLPEVLPKLESFVSSEDIASGTLWLQKLFEQLANSESGILCLTKESLDRNWILFEAGALAKQAGNETVRVCPLLFEFKTLNFPLAAFQAHILDKGDETRSKKEMLLLIKTLNQNRPAALCFDEDQLERQFDRCWNEFWIPYVQLCEKHAHAKKPQAAVRVSNEEILAEMRGAFRQFADVLTEIRRSSSVIAALEQPAELQQFTVQCPFCKSGNEVLMPDRPGETKPTICSSCGARFNAHMTKEHSVFVRAISPASAIRSQLPMIAETVQCPSCQEKLTVELPERNGETRTPLCPKCKNTIYVHRKMGGGVLVRSGGQHSGGGLDTDWGSFLSETQSWVEPVALSNLVSITVAVSAENGEGAELTSDGLCKKIFLRMDAAPSSGLSRSMVRIFIKTIFFGGAFHFPLGVGQTTWRTPFSNKLIPEDLIRAYAHGVIRRLRSKFVLSATDLPELLKLLFPAEMAEAVSALRQALTDVK